MRIHEGEEIGEAYYYHKQVRGPSWIRCWGVLFHFPFNKFLFPLQKWLRMKCETYIQGWGIIQSLLTYKTHALGCGGGSRSRPFSRSSSVTRNTGRPHSARKLNLFLSYKRAEEEAGSREEENQVLGRDSAESSSLPSADLYLQR